MFLATNLEEGLLLHLNAVLLLELESERVGDFGRHRSDDTPLADLSVQHLLDGDCAGHTNGLGHGAVAGGLAVLDKGRRASLLGAVLVRDAKLVLQDDKVALALFVLHLLLERGAKGIEGVAAGLDLLVREETDPLEARNDALLLLVVGELGL